jgi:hypothetical protein
LVNFGGHKSAGTVIDSRINRRWNKHLKQHLPYEIVYLISFGSGTGCWYPEEQVLPIENESR